MSENKAITIVLCVFFALFAFGILCRSYVDAVNNPKLIKLQQNCVEHGYGYYENGKFILKESRKNRNL